MTTVRAGQFKHASIFLGIFILCAALIKPAQDRLDARLGDQPPGADLLYFTPSVLKKVALGHDQFVADFYWMRTIQYYGRRDEADKRPVRYKNLSALLDTTTTLDPGLLDAYRVGSYFLAEPDPVGAGQPLEALKLLDKGIRAHPGEWRLLHDKGFIYYWFNRDYKSAGEAWRAASRLEGAPHWMEPLAAMSLSKGGALEIAQALWENQYRESSRADVKENARNHLISIEVARDIWTLELLIRKYQAENRPLPPSLAELVGRERPGYRIVDPTGTPYRYDPVTGAVSLSPESKVRYIPIPEAYKEKLGALK